MSWHTPGTKWQSHKPTAVRKAQRFTQTSNKHCFLPGISVPEKTPALQKCHKGKTKRILTLWLCIILVPMTRVILMKCLWYLHGHCTNFHRDISFPGMFNTRLMGKMSRTVRKGNYDISFPIGLCDSANLNWKFSLGYNCHNRAFPLVGLVPNALFSVEHLLNPPHALRRLLPLWSNLD